ncbi:MAG: tRNA (adenosine(37)-N6)-threonylcarbamoyltransferase complex transferase subunit TsaD [Actinomycetota bacterium]|nr:tRNA (adenosine(37)-N6)-threonylcarbamoyltransferase complex transferase subunit TsaD [Actinomycetota bacterium]
MNIQVAFDEIVEESVGQFEPEVEPLLEQLAEPSDQPIVTLGVETSCDETSVSILSGERTVLSNVVSSSADLHNKYGGVVPEIASRAHVQAMNPAIAEALSRADATMWDVDVVAVTIGPGLIGSLVVGVAAAKSLAAVLEVPLVGVNHLEAHIYANYLEHDNIELPAMVLLVSGGHTMLIHMQGHGLYEVVGRTLDDAVGEAFDKVARYLGLGFPGGPLIDELATKGDPSAIAFPRPMKNDGFDFSLSGLKTAVLNHMRKQKAAGVSPKIEDVCASFQEAVVDVQVDKTIKAAIEVGTPTVLLSGGVAANSRLRQRLKEACDEAELDLKSPSLSYCTDNAAMVACCGFHRYRRGIRSGLDINPDPNLPLA